MKYSSSEVYTLTNNNDEEVFSGPICSQYFTDILVSKILGQSVAFIVVFMNIILKFTIMYMVFFIGEETASQQKATVTRGVFLGQFANTGFVILLVNANLTEHQPHEITKYFKGPFYDYMPLWYIDAGLKIQLAMVIQMFMPIVSCTITNLVPKLKKTYDNGGTDDFYNTKCTTLAWYKWFNGGSEYMIHFKYSDALNVTFVAMMYGLSIPMLFPIAAVTLKLQQLAERIAVAWVARMPPAMGNDLNNNAISMLKFAPLFMLMNGFWMVDNQTIFNNQWNYIMRLTDFMRSSHFFQGWMYTQSTPLLVFIIVFCIMKFLDILVPESVQSNLGFSA